jgi:polyphosphate kinase
LRDNVNAREMRADGSYQKVKPQPGEAAVNSQMAMYALLQDDWAGTGAAAPKPTAEKQPEQVPEKAPEKVQEPAPERPVKPQAAQPAPRPAPRVTVKQQTWLERLWGRLGRK